MKIYKFLRGLLKASALTTVMFVMQACYGSPYQDRDMPDPTEMGGETSVADTLVSADLPSAEADYEDLQSE